MRWVYNYFFAVIWIAFFIYWQIAAIRAKTTRRMEAISSRTFRVVLFACAIAVLSLPRLPFPWLYHLLYPRTAAGFWLGAAINVAGILFCVWARVHLGMNWSRSVTVKEDHELITTGPYAWVRHPIYTGILTGFLGMAIAVAEVRGVVAFLLILIALWLKWRLEEKWMGEQFGQTYADYARRVPAVVPRPM